MLDRMLLNQRQRVCQAASWKECLRKDIRRYVARKSMFSGHNIPLEQCNIIALSGPITPSDKL
jgi:hypothetical protein